MLLAPRAGEAILFNHLDRADSWPVDQTVDQAQSETSAPWCCRAGWPTPTSCG